METFLDFDSTVPENELDSPWLDPLDVPRTFREAVQGWLRTSDRNERIRERFTTRHARIQLLRSNARS